MAIEVQGVCPLLQVFDMPTSIRFYRQFFGFQVIQSSRPLSQEPEDVNWAMLELNGATLMLNTAYEPQERPSAPDPSRIASHADTSLYFGCPDVDQTYRELCAQGLEVKPPVIAPYGMKQLSVVDPDGYHLCFQWPA